MNVRPLILTSLLVAVAACTHTPPPETDEPSVRPGINDDFTDPALDVDAMVKRFEAESREIFAQRARIARAVGLRPGMAVADVGAGTGVFVDLFAQDVGSSGRVYAVEIAPKFVERLAERARQRGQLQVSAVLGDERDVRLPAASCDVVFACDTYHHFQFPQSSLASIHRALRPHGELVVVDFERIPGTSRAWILEHVRCGKEQVVQEVTAAGFTLAEELPVGLQENYVLRFRRDAQR